LLCIVFPSTHWPKKLNEFTTGTGVGVGEAFGTAFITQLQILLLGESNQRKK